MNKNIYKNKINYFVINRSKQWTKRIPKIKHLIDLILDYPQYFIDKKYQMNEITFLLTDDVGIKKFNSKFRKKPFSTDILTFTSDQKLHNNKIIRLCDIVLSVDYIKKDVLRLKKNFYFHLTHLIIHGLLHNNGYTHNTIKEEKKMQNLEQKILNKLNAKKLF